MKRKAFVIIALVLVFAALALLAACASEDLPEWAFDALKEQDNARAEGTDVRVMSVNVLVHIKSWGGLPVRPRDQTLEEFTRHYAPEVVALQEMCSEWYAGSE